MKSPKTRATLNKERCPSCTREFLVGLTMSRNGIRCPHCRATVTLRTPETEPSKIAEREELPPPKAHDSPADPRGECEALRGRIERLERTMENHLRSHSSAEPVTAPESCDEERSGADGTLPLPFESNGNGNGNGNGSHADAEPIVTDPKGVVHLIVAVQDAPTRERAATIAAVLARAGWSTRERPPARGPCGVPLGLTLSVSSAIARARLTSIFDALREADFQVRLQLDPTPREEEAILFIGASVAEE